MNAEAQTALATLRRQLATCRRQFAAIVDNVMEGVAIAINGRLAYANPFLERMTGYDAATLCSKPFVEFLHAADRGDVLTAHCRRLAGEAAPAGQLFRIVTRAGETRWVQTASARIDWEEVPASLSLLSDITLQRQTQMALAELIRDQEARIASRTSSLLEANRTLETANERLSQEIEEHERTARKLSAARKKASEASKAKSVFLANMSHEIRTPLNVILGMADLALRPDSQGQVDHVRALEMIREAGSTLRGLLGDLLDLSRVEAGRLTLESIAFSPRRVLEAVLLARKELAARQGVILEGAIAPDVPETLVGDPGRLGQVLGNLVGNALKFTPSGRIDVAVHRVPSPTSRKDDAATVHLSFSVRDTGVGIAPEKKRTIFQSFRQADDSVSRQYGGSGLGLAICRRLVTLLGGRIRVASRPGEGSEFSFTARFALPAPGEAVAVPAAPVAPALPTLDILLAEDADLSAEMIQTFLTPRGHCVIRASNGREALDMLAMRCFDLVLMDIRMPVMDGLTATRTIREGGVPGCDPALPIIALTAQGETREREAILAAGATAYLAKPVNLDKLLETMAQVLSGQPVAGERPQIGAPRPASPVAADEARPFDAGRDEALENLGGDAELYDRLAAVFLRDIPGDRQQLRQAMRREDWDATVLVAHTIKGNAGVLGATATVRHAREVEAAAREGRYGTLGPLADALEAELERVVTGLTAKGIVPAA